jgi:ferric-dicitrate binding protein FerR (iron transport regulator)
VEITGEAYFEVARNTAMPFKVTIASSKAFPLQGAGGNSTPPLGGGGALEIEVLGTSFNVMAYEDDTTISTTLLEGAVRVTKGTAIRTIAPGQQLIAGGEGPMHLATDVDIQKIIAWKNGKFIFYNDDIRNIMKQLTRWYDIDVHFTGEVHDHYSGRISRQVNISQVLKMMEAAGGVSFSVRGKEVKIN